MTESKASAQGDTAQDKVREAYAARFRAQQPMGDAAMQKRRQAAMDAFLLHGIPTAKLEAWKKTPLRALQANAFAAVPRPTTATAEQIRPFQIEGTSEVVFVDGRLDTRLSRLDPLPKGVTVKSFSETPAIKVGDIAPTGSPEHALTDLNTALFDDGLQIHVADRARIEAPLHILFITTGGAPHSSTFPRLLVTAGRDGDVTIVETHAGIGDAATFTDSVVEMDAGEGSRIQHVRIQREGPAAQHVGTVAVLAARDAEVRTFSLSEGAALCRVDVRAKLAGEGSSCRLDGIFLGTGDQHVDHNTFIDHATPHTTSREVYKGILAGKAHGVFTGNILVRPGAQQTDSEQENRNLLLSDKALVDTTPQLEIYADDVKCRHGSTIGRLPADQLFYLRSRGFSLADARKVLTLAFAAEALEHVQHAGVREALRGRVSGWLANTTAPAEAPKKGTS